MSKKVNGEDIVMLDAHTPQSSPSCTSFTTQLSCPIRIHPTPPHSFGDISMI
jgi:hypothetical protein